MCRSRDNTSDFIFDHMVDNKLGIVALTETWLSNDETKRRRVVMDCAKMVIHYTTFQGVVVKEVAVWVN